MIILVPDETNAPAVDLALVRWGTDPFFEFVSMSTAEQDRVRQFLAFLAVVE